MPKNSLKNEENEPDDWRDGGRDEDDVLVRNVDRRKQETVERGRHLEEVHCHRNSLCVGQDLVLCGGD